MDTFTSKVFDIDLATKNLTVATQNNIKYDRLRIMTNKLASLKVEGDKIHIDSGKELTCVYNEAPEYKEVVCL